MPAAVTAAVPVDRLSPLRRAAEALSLFLALVVELAFPGPGERRGGAG